MKKLMIIPIFLAFGIALMQMAGVPTPSIVESFQASVAFKRHVANGMTPLEASDLSKALPSTLLSAATPAFTPSSTRAGTPVNNLSPIGIGIAIFASTGKDIPATALNPTNMATATTVTWATWTATVTGVATNMATYTVGVKPEPPSPLLDRLIKNKPSVWGNKGFYVLLGALYLTLLGLFLRQILDTVKRRS